MKLSHIGSRFLTLLLSVVLVGMFTFEAEARRLGGGKSMGRQSSNVTQREAAPPTAPGQSSATAGRAASSAFTAWSMPIIAASVKFSSAAESTMRPISSSALSVRSRSSRCSRAR